MNRALIPVQQKNSRSHSSSRSHKSQKGFDEARKSAIELSKYNESMRSQIDLLSQERARLESALAKSSQRCTSLQGQLQQSQGGFIAFDKDMQNVKYSMKVALQKNEILSKKLEELKSAKAQVTNDIQELTKFNTVLRTQLNDTEQTLQDLVSYKSNWAEELKKITESKEVTSYSLNSLQADHESLKSELSGSQSALESTKSQLQSASTQLSETRAELHSMREICASKNDRLEDLKGTEASLNKELTHAKKSLQQAEAQRQAAEAEVRALTNSAQTERDLQERKLASLNADHAQQLEDVKFSLARAAQQQAQAAQLAADEQLSSLQTAQREVQRLSNRSKRLETELADARQCLDDRRASEFTQQEKREQEKVELQRQLQQARIELSDSKRALNRLQQSSRRDQSDREDQLVKKLSLAEERLAETEDERAAAERALAAANLSNKTADASYRQLEKQITDVRSKLARELKHSAELHQQQQQSRKQHRQSQKEHQREHDEHDRQISQLRDELRELRDESDSLKKELMSVRDDAERATAAAEEKCEEYRIAKLAAEQKILVKKQDDEKRNRQSKSAAASKKKSKAEELKQVEFAAADASMTQAPNNGHDDDKGQSAEVMIDKAGDQIGAASPFKKKDAVRGQTRRQEQKENVIEKKKKVSAVSSENQTVEDISEVSKPSLSKRVRAKAPRRLASLTVNSSSATVVPISSPDLLNDSPLTSTRLSTPRRTPIVNSRSARKRLDRLLDELVEDISDVDDEKDNDNDDDEFEDQLEDDRDPIDYKSRPVVKQARRQVQKKRQQLRQPPQRKASTPAPRKSQQSSRQKTTKSAASGSETPDPFAFLG